MITRAAVRIYDCRQKKEIIIPCHRHSDAYEILYNLGYKKAVDYHVLQEGFLDDVDTFLNRHDAYLEAKQSNQLLIVESNIKCSELFSEDLW